MTERPALVTGFAPYAGRGSNPAADIANALDGCIIECPLHFAQFDIRTGKYVDGPLAADVPAYEVRLADGTVYLKAPAAA